MHGDLVMEISIFEAYEMPEGQPVPAVLNIEHGRLRAALLVPNKTKVLCWLGRACIHATVPQRQIGEYYAENYQVETTREVAEKEV